MFERVRRSPEVRLVLVLVEGAARLMWMSMLASWLAVLAVAFDYWDADPRFSPWARGSLALIMAALGHDAWRLARIRQVTPTRPYHWGEAFHRPVAAPAAMAAILTGGLLAVSIFARWAAALPSLAVAGSALDLGLTLAALAVARLDAVLGRYEPGGPLEPLLEQKPELLAWVRLGRRARDLAFLIAGAVAFVVAGSAMLLARAVRMREEREGYSCPREGCHLRFDDPPMVCRRCLGQGAQPIHTWPRLEAPLFVICPQCRSVHYTWWSVQRATARRTARFWNGNCRYLCNREAPDGRRRYRILLLCLGTRPLPAVLSRLEAWLGRELNPRAGRAVAWLRRLEEHGLHARLPDTPITARFESPGARRSLRVDLVRPGDSTRWAGDHDWVVVLPRHSNGAGEEVERETGFALHSIELPLGAAPAAFQPPRSESRRRLFGSPVNPTPSSRPRLHTRLAVWTASSVSLTHRGQPVVPVAGETALDAFLEDTR